MIKNMNESKKQIMGLWRNITFAAPMAPAHHQLIVLTPILGLLESSVIFGWYFIL